MFFKSKPRWVRSAFAGASLAGIIATASCSGLGMAPTTVSAASSPREATEPAFESWRSVMQRLPKPNNACLVASYPALEWHQVPCAQPPTSPLLPAFGAKHETVGDGKDFAAVVPGQISFAEGGFSNLSGVKSEYVLKRKHHIANTYSLQLNTQFLAPSRARRSDRPIRKVLRMGAVCLRHRTADRFIHRVLAGGLRSGPYAMPVPLA